LQAANTPPGSRLSSCCGRGCRVRRSSTFKWCSSKSARSTRSKRRLQPTCSSRQDGANRNSTADRRPITRYSSLFFVIDTPNTFDCLPVSVYFPEDQQSRVWTPLLGTFRIHCIWGAHYLFIGYFNGKRSRSETVTSDGFSPIQIIFYDYTFP